jgi:hypothetical protein
MDFDGPYRRASGHGRTAEAKLKPDYILSVPFDGWTKDQINEEVDSFIAETGLYRYENDFRRGAFLAQNKRAFDRPRTDGLVLDDEERARLDLERSERPIDKFKQSPRLYFLVALCSIGAAVQGVRENAWFGLLVANCL